jgi:transposase
MPTRGRVPASAARLALTPECVRTWLKRCNAAGLAELADRPRRGRPVVYTPEQVSMIIEVALTLSATLGVPFVSWTLDRWETYLNEEKAIPIKRKRIDERLLAEGLRWRQQGTWFSAKGDPDFAGKRGRSSSSTPRRLRAAASSV